MESIEAILEKDVLEREDLIRVLEADGADCGPLFRRAAEVKAARVGNRVYLRGLIEYSNLCSKNCLYCGIRSGNAAAARYEMTPEETIEVARHALERRYGSIVIQAGERDDALFVSKIERTLRGIRALAGDGLHVTLSLGEQTPDTYRRWFEAGAHRYLLRIEASNPDLFRKLHPDDARHRHALRLAALGAVRAAGYQVGTGVMIGLPFQTAADLADDLLFFRDLDVDMIGMGPYLEHPDTPLYARARALLPPRERLELTLRMVALLRVMMGDINIAATTAMQAIDPEGRERAIRAGANVVMPNLTPARYRHDYLLYENKPCLDEAPEESVELFEARIREFGGTIAYGEWGDSRRFLERTS